MYADPESDSGKTMCAIKILNMRIYKPIKSLVFNEKKICLFLRRLFLVFESSKKNKRKQTRRYVKKFRPKPFLVYVLESSAVTKVNAEIPRSYSSIFFVQVSTNQ